jgi:hypothetical protein
MRWARWIFLERTPSWISKVDGERTCGTSLADLDNDGWLDLIVANGCDIDPQPIAVYYNNRDGTFPLVPTWTSLDLDYNGHVSVGDINKDGWKDLAVAVLLGPDGSHDQGKLKVYFNNGTGQLEQLPSWRSADNYSSFSCALGDADGDGDLDLAVATTSFPPEPDTTSNRIYFNVDGNLDTIPGWFSTEQERDYEVLWGDVDKDGDLDLAFCGYNCPIRIHYNDNGIINSTAEWRSADESTAGIQLNFGDMDGDGWLDLAVADGWSNSRFEIFYNDGSGNLEHTPSWQSYNLDYASEVSIVDVDNDGDLDLSAGAWGSEALIYENMDFWYITPFPNWRSTTYSTIETMTWGDVNNDGLITIENEMHLSDGNKVFYVTNKWLHSMISVIVNDSIVPYEDYCYDLEQGWISLAFIPEEGESIEIKYRYSTLPDLAVSNWDPVIGNYLFYNSDSYRSK